MSYQHNLASPSLATDRLNPLVTLPSPHRSIFQGGSFGDEIDYSLSASENNQSEINLNNGVVRVQEIEDDI
jgi:hypothetical protein